MLSTRSTELMRQSLSTQPIKHEENVTFGLHNFNSSTQESFEQPYKLSHPMSYFLLAISNVGLLVTFYLFVCVILFIKRKPLQKLENAEQSVNKLNVSSNGPIGSPIVAIRNDKNVNSKTGTTTQLPRARPKQSVKPSQKRSFQAAQAMHYILLCTLGLNLVRSLCEQLLFYVGNTSAEFCSLITKIIIGVTGFIIHGCFVFLWLRQYIFYTNPLLRNIRPKILKWVSFATYAEMVITVLLCMVIHIWWRDYTSEDGECVPSVGSKRVPATVPYVVLVASTVTIQMSLTFLFVYPIVNHHKQMEAHRKRHTIQPETLNKISRSADRLLECVKRALVAATVAVTTDVIGSFVGIWTADAMPIFLFSVLYGLDVLLNILCLFYTYVHWRDIVFPWRARKRYNKEKTRDKKSKKTLLS